MSDPSSDAAVDESDACCAVFLEWLAAHGANTSLLEWPCFSWPGLPHDGVRGVAAKNDIDAGAVMFTIPGSLMIDRRTCLASGIGHIFLDNPSLFSSLDEVALSLLLAYETFCKGSSSFWWPFIQSLPRSPGSTISWSQSEMECLQDTELAHSTRALLSKIQKVFRSQIQPLQQQHRPQLDGIDFTRFLWAWACVGSRTFGRFLPYPSLVPFADMLNHVNVHTTYCWDGANAVYFNDARAPAAARSELCFSYGPRSNALLLLHYGFAIQENAYDSVDVEATVRAGARCFKQLCTLTRKLSLELWMFVRAACGCSFQRPEVGQELAVISAVLRLLLSLRSQWPTSLEHDESLLREEAGLSLRHRFALFHRIGRKQVVRKLETAMAYLASCLGSGYRACSAADRDILDGAGCDGDCRVLEALGLQLCGCGAADVPFHDQLYSRALHSLRKSRRSGTPELGLNSPALVARSSCGQELSNVTFVACGQNMSACIQDGVLFATGSADFGKLGHSKTEFDMPYQEILFRSVPLLKRVIVVACGGNHTVCIDASAAVFAWGENVYGQCGLGFTCQQVTCPRAMVVEEQFHSVVCGEAVTLLSNSSGVHSCGCNLEGECGLGAADASIEIPTRVELPDHGVVRVSCRWRHSIVVLTSGQVFVWGSAENSRIGVPATHQSITAKYISAAGNSAVSFGKNAAHARDSCVGAPLLLSGSGGPLPAVVDAAAGFKTSVFVTEDGAVYACGAVGHDEGEMPLHHVVGLPPCSRVWSGSSHGFLLTKDRHLLAYGKTSSGRLGCALSEDIKFVPICDAASMVVDVPGTSSLEIVSCGQAQSLFVFGGGNSEAHDQSRARNSLFACGRIEYGELGLLLPVRNVIDSACERYRIACLQPPPSHMVNCHSCRVMPIVGNRYVCTSSMQSYCSACFDRSERSLLLVASCVLPQSVGISMMKELKLSGAEFHVGVQCHFCQERNFKGWRYKNGHAPDVDACGSCFQDAALRCEFPSHHVWILMMRPILGKLPRARPMLPEFWARACADTFVPPVLSSPGS